MRVLWLLIGVVGLVSVPGAESTIGLLGAALPVAAIKTAPAIAAIGGLSAVKILKVIGLAALKNKVANGIADAFDNGDEYDDYYSRESGYYAPPPLSHGPPSFYIVPSDYFDRRRGKREAQGEERPAETVKEVDYFNVTATLDTDGCAQRLVCELAQKPRDELKEDERAIMFSFSTEVAPAPSTIRSSKGVFDYAAWLGRNSAHNSKACETFYKQCQSNSQEIMEAFRLIEAKEVVGDNQEVSKE
ncbi:uncharacterized protein LOC135199885 [Macrobrachium nipponense]|uniref:uncharacterized protein LOC135199885 n=1 Tax=Macrobrachium nipponense TaxID=159736 RepID=UPI0030C80DFF